MLDDRLHKKAGQVELKFERLAFLSFFSPSSLISRMFVGLGSFIGE